MLAQHRHRRVERAVGTLDLSGVTAQVVAESRETRQMGRQFDLVGIDMPGVGIPGMVRVVVVDPEKPGTPGRYLTEELIEQLRRRSLGRDVEEVDTIFPGAHLVLLIGLFGDTARGNYSIQMKIPAANAGVIASGTQHLGSGDDIRRQRGAEAAHTRGHRRASGHQRCPRWYTLRRGRECTLEQHALARELIERRSGHPACAVDAEIRIAMIVGQDEQNVWRRVLSLQSQWRGRQGLKQAPPPHCPSTILTPRSAYQLPPLFDSW